MKLLLIAAASTAILGGSAYAQNSQSRVPEPEARTPGQPSVGSPQTTDPRTTTGRAPSKLLAQWGRRRMAPRAAQLVLRIPIVCRPALQVDKACLQIDREGKWIGHSWAANNVAK
jgi:hypothetical protein